MSKAKLHKGFECGNLMFLMGEEKITVFEHRNDNYAHVTIISRTDFDEMANWYLDQKKLAGGKVIEDNKSSGV